MNSWPGCCSLEGVCRRADGGKTSPPQSGRAAAGSEGPWQRQSGHSGEVWAEPRNLLEEGQTEFADGLDCGLSGQQGIQADL